MGWNSWNLFGSNITEAKVKAVADAFVTSGLRDAGYKYIVVDDCWQNATRDGSGALVAQSSKFPSGMKSLGDYVHGKGLKFGMYTTANPVTCCFEAGSYTYETKDVQTFAGWGVDYLKYDWCGVQSGEDATNITAQQIIARYVTMRNSLKSTNRPIVFAICEKGQKSHIVPGTWSDTVGHLWRIGGDIGANWSSITSIIDANASLNIYAGPSKGWKDPDMLEVGNGSLTENENRAHFSMWCIMAAPLILGNDPSTMPVAIKSIVTNKDAIAINQDSLGFQGVRIRKTGEQEVWVKPLMNGDKAVALFNRATSTVTMTVNWTDSLIKWSTTTKVKVSNVWAQKDSSNVTNSFSSSVASRAVVLLRLQNILTTNSSHSANRVTHDPLDAVRIIKVPDGITVDIPHVNEAVKVDLLDARGRLLYSFISYGGNQKVPGNRLTTGVIIVRVSFQMHNSVGVSIFCVPAETAALVPAVRRQ